MQTDSNSRHPSFCALIDKSLAGAASAQEEQTLREHLAGCAPCAEHLEATRRVVAGLEGFSFAPGPALDSKVLRRSLCGRSNWRPTASAAGRWDGAACWPCC